MGLRQGLASQPAAGQSQRGSWRLAMPAAGCSLASHSAISASAQGISEISSYDWGWGLRVGKENDTLLVYQHLNRRWRDRVSLGWDKTHWNTPPSRQLSQHSWVFWGERVLAAPHKPPAPHCPSLRFQRDTDHWLFQDLGCFSVPTRTNKKKRASTLAMGK